MAAQASEDHRLYLLALLAPRPVDEDWEAEKAGWRAFVMDHADPGDHVSGRLQAAGCRLHAAWQRGYDAASRSSDPVGLML